MLWEEKEEQILLKTTPEFSFTQNLNYLSRSTNECLFHIHDNKVRKAITVDKYTTLVEVKEHDEHTLLIEFLGNTRPEKKELREQVVAYIFDWFDLKTDLNLFYKLAEKDPMLNQAILQFRGLRIMGIPDLFEAMAWGILGQQINLPFAYTLKETSRRKVWTLNNV